VLNQRARMTRRSTRRHPHRRRRCRGRKNSCVFVTGAVWFQPYRICIALERRRSLRLRCHRGNALAAGGTHPDRRSAEATWIQNLSHLLGSSGTPEILVGAVLFVLSLASARASARASASRNA
jgi:hypothetical protein